MKKVINNIAFVSICFACFSISSCESKKEESKAPNTEEILQQVNTVIAIGKVTAGNGTAVIASKVSGMVQAIVAQEGETVKEGDVILKLSANSSNIDVELANNKLQSAQDQSIISKKDLEREQISLKNLEQKYLTSKALLDKKAETEENFRNDETNYLQQKQKVETLQKQLDISKIQIKEQQLNINKSKISLADYTIKAAMSGIISSLDVKIGENVSNNQTLGEIIDTKQIIIEAEVDELFADKIRVGQAVNFININTKQNLGAGEIVYSSPILMNKSILYETANEANDRRVLKIKIKPKENTQLLINAKVECQIQIQ